MKGIRSYKDLVVWQKAMNLVDLVYEITSGFPAQEKFKLTSQITKSATSVPANLAEGRGRVSEREFANFVSIARGSLCETETYILIASRQKYCSYEQSKQALALIDEVGRMLTSLHTRLSAKQRSSPKA